MQQWQYCRLVWIVRQLSESDKQSIQDFTTLRDETRELGALAAAGFGTLRFLGSGQDRERIGNADETIARLGREGWEMVSHTVSSGTSIVDTYYFKRSVEE